MVTEIKDKWINKENPFKIPPVDVPAVDKTDIPYYLKPPQVTQASDVLPSIPPEGITYKVQDDKNNLVEMRVLEDFEYVGSERKLKSNDYIVYSGNKEVGRYVGGTGEFVAKEPSWWQKVLGAGAQALQWGLVVPSLIGISGKYPQDDAESMAKNIAYDELRKYYDTLPQGFYRDFTEYRNSAAGYDDYQRLVMKSLPEAKELQKNWIKEALPGGKLHEKFRELPMGEQLAYEAAFWAYLGVAGVSATGARATLAPAAARGGITGGLAQAGRAALAPVAGYEWVAGKVIETTVNATYRTVMSSVLRRNLRSWARSVGKVIPRETENAFVEQAVNQLSPSWLTKQAIKTLFKPVKGGYTITEAGATAAEKAAIQAVRTSPLLLGVGAEVAVTPAITPAVTGISGEVLGGVVPKVTPTVLPAAPEITKAEFIKTYPYRDTTLEGELNKIKEAGETGIEYGLITREQLNQQIRDFEAVIDRTYQAVQVEAVTPTAPVVEPTAIPKPPVSPVVETPVVSKIAALEARRVEIQKLLSEPAKNLPKDITKIELRKELKEVSTNLAPAEKSLRQTIMATVKAKGLPQSQYAKIFRDKGGSRHLSDITYTNLNKVLESVRVARPVKIKGKTVLKLATENNIQTLKNILIAEKKITPELYEDIKRVLKLKTDKYEGISNFITESEAGNLIREMNFEAEVGLSEWDTRVAEAMASQPNIKASIDRISSGITTANVATLNRKVGIDWRKFAIEISDVPNDVGLSGTMSILRALRRFQEQLGGRSVTRIYDVAEIMTETRRLNDVRLAQRISRMKAEVPELLRVVKNKAGMERIQQWLDADLKTTKVEKPTDITPEELKVAQLFRREYDQWKDVVRLERFKDAYYHYKGKADLIKKGEDAVAIPDAPLADIKKGISIYEGQGETALNDYLKTKDWGVIESGYSFSQVIHPQLKMGKRYAVRATTTSLHQRQGLDFLRDERTPWERLVSYERQMIGLNLQPYFRKMDREFAKIVRQGRMSEDSIRAAATKLSLFLQETKGFPLESPVARFLLKVGGWSFGTLSKVPWMSVRNLHQNIAFHSDKSEILRAIFTRGFYANSLTRNGRVDYTDALVHQYQGVMQEQFLMGYMGKTPIENLIRRTDYYHLSDKLNRNASMAGSGAKAERALNEYLKDGDVDKFLRDSGANELSQTEQLRVLEYLALPDYNYGGVLDVVSGGEAAIRDIANRITTINHFNYIRYLRSVSEMGETGRILGSLVAFPRSVAEKYVDIFSRLRPSRKLNWADRRRAIHSLLAIIIGSAIASVMLNGITGKERDPYNPFLVLQWQVGGLAVGATENLTELYRQLSNLTFARDDDDRNYAMEQLAILIPQLGDSFIPFYSSTMNFIESLTDSRYLDREYMRKLRAMFDESYKPNAEFYEIERTMIEKMQHALFGTNTPDPTDIEVSLKKLTGITDKLGNVDEKALNEAKQKAFELNMPFQYQPSDYVYMTGNMASDINSAVYSLDPSEIILENGFSQLVLDYMEYQEMFKKYQVVPTDKRYDYREQNSELDANLFFWGYATTLQSDTARSLVLQMINKYSIPANAIKGYNNAIQETAPTPTKLSGWEGRTNPFQ